MSKKNSIFFFVKVSISLGLIAYLIWIIDWEEARMTISQSNKTLIFLSPGFWLMSLIAGSLRWRFVLADNQVNFSQLRAYAGYLIGTFYNIFLPGAVGGDAVRIGICVRQTKCKMGIATASVFLERISGVVALLSFLLIVSVFFPTTISSLVTNEPSLNLPVISSIGIIVIVILVWSRRWWVRKLPDESSNRLKNFLITGIRSFGTIRRQTLISILVLSAIFQATRIAGIYTLSLGIHLNLPLSVFFAVIPLVYITTLLPISLGGLGVREGTLVLLLSQFRVSTSDAVTLSFLIYLNQVFLGSLGGLVQLIGFNGKNKADDGQESPADISDI